MVKKKLKKHKKVLIILLIVLIIGVIVAVVLGGQRKKRATTKNKEVRQNTISLEKMDLTTSISATGTIASKKTKTVSADLNGVEVKQVKVSVGDEVQKGDALVTFDESDLQEALTEALENQTDTEDEVDKNVESAKEQLSDAKETYEDEKESLAEKVSEAKKELAAAKKQVSSAKNAEEKSKAEEALKQAETSYENAVSNRKTTNKQNKEKIESAEDAVDTAKSNGKKNIKEAKKQVEEAQENLEKCAVTAPISGVITAIGVEEGDTYSGGTMFQIDDTSSYTVSTTVDEYDISSVSVGQRVAILTEATDDDELEGEITFVAPSTSSSTISSGNSQSGESAMTGTSSTGGYEVEIAIKTQDERLKMGLTAKCSIILEEVNDVYAVPYDAVHENSDGTTVIYVSEGSGSSTSKREVQVTKGMESDYYVEISGADLTDGMLVQIPTDETSTAGSSEKSEESGFTMPGGGSGMPSGGGMPGGSSMGGNRGSGGGGMRPGM